MKKIIILDFDGTIAEHGNVPGEVCEALLTLKNSGRKLLLITGRELQALKHQFSRLDLFDLVVAENGALLYDPATDTEELIADPASPEDYQLRRSRAGDAWDRSQADSCGAPAPAAAGGGKTGVSLGMPALPVRGR